MITIQVQGLEELRRKFSRMPKSMNKRLNWAVEYSAGLIIQKAKPITPWDTGRLRGATRMYVFRNLYAEVAARTDYAEYVHEGTRRWPLHMPPKKPGTVRQFLKIGAERAMPEINKTFDKAVGKALED